MDNRNTKNKYDNMEKTENNGYKNKNNQKNMNKRRK